MQLKEHHLITADEPFNGIVQSSTYFDSDNIERVSWSGYLDNNKGEDLTLTEYLKRHPGLRAVTNDEMDKLIQEYQQSRTTDPAPITEEHYNEMLEILPPGRHHDIGIWEVFYVTERIHYNLVHWFAAKNGSQYVSWIDLASVTDDEIRSKLANYRS